MSRQADLSKVIWSAMVRVVKPGSRLANSTILMMHLVESSLNLSQSPRSSWTRWSELEFWKHHKEFTLKKNRHSAVCTRTPHICICHHSNEKKSIHKLHQSFSGFVVSCISETTTMLGNLGWIEIFAYNWGVFSNSKVARMFATYSRSEHKNYTLTWATYSCVFSKLAKWWEGFLVSFADFVDQLLELSTKLIALRKHHLLLDILLLFVSIVTYCYIKTTLKVSEIIHTVRVW